MGLPIARQNLITSFFFVLLVGFLGNGAAFSQSAANDMLPPLVILEIPYPGSEDVDTDVALFVTFSENVVLGTGNAHIYNAYSGY